MQALTWGLFVTHLPPSWFIIASPCLATSLYTASDTSGGTCVIKRVWACVVFA